MPRGEVPGLLADADALVNNMRAGATDKVVYEAAATLPAGARLEPCPRRLPARASCGSSATTPRASPTGSARSRPPTEPRSAASCASASSATTRSRAGRDRVVELAQPVTAARSSARGKVSGISGSEKHLLLLLPQLRERGWDVRFVLLHEGEPAR